MADFIPFLDWKSVGKTVAKKLTVGNDIIFFDDYKIPPICSEPFTSEFVTIWLIQKGSILFSVGGIKFKAKAPCIVVLQPNVPRKVAEESKNAKKKLLALSKGITDNLFEKPMDKMFFGRTFLLNPVLSLNEKKYKTYLLYFDLIRQEMEDSDNPNPERTIAGILRTLISKYSTNNLHTNISTNRKENLVQKFFVKLNGFHQKERSTDFYARALSITPQHLSKILREETGKPAGEWIDIFVVESLKASVRSKKKSICTLTEMFTFDTVDALGKYFKRHAGISPSEYRKKYGF